MPNSDSNFDEKDTEQINQQRFWFEMFGFITGQARRNFIITIFTMLVLWAVSVTIQVYRSERRFSREKQELIDNYEAKTDSLYMRIINLKTI